MCTAMLQHSDIDLPIREIVAQPQHQKGVGFRAVGVDQDRLTIGLISFPLL
jgi:hypothetical protein